MLRGRGSRRSRRLLRLAAVPALALTLAVPATDAGAAPGTITTIAGGTPEGGPAPQASLRPVGLALDAGGRVFVADTAANVIYRMAGGVLARVAGIGDACRAGDCASEDGNPALTAALDGLGEIALAPSGDLYFTTGNRVRRVAAAGKLATVAGNGDTAYSPDHDGGPATEASLWGPGHIAVDSTGNLFIADAYHQRVRKVSPDGIITTVAGCGDYKFPSCTHPSDGGSTDTYIGYPSIVVGPDDRLYSAANGAIWWIDTANGVMRLVAGRAYEYTDACYQTTEVAATDARFTSFTSLEFGPGGDLFVIDGMCNRIRKISAPVGPTSTVTHVAGCFCGPASIDDRYNGFSGDGSNAKSAQFAFARTGGDLVIDAAGNLLVSDTGNRRVRRIDGATNVVTTVAGNGAGGPYSKPYVPYDFQPNPFAGEGSVKGGGMSGDGGPSADARLAGPGDVVADAGGNLYVLDMLNQRVRRIAANGTITTVAGGGECSWGCSRDATLRDGPAAASVLYSPTAIALDATGTQLAIADRYHERVRLVNLGSTPLTLYATSPTPVTIPAGNIATVFGNGGSCFLLSPDCGEGRHALQAQAGAINGVAFDAAGNLHVSDSFLGQIRRADRSTGIVMTVAGVQFTAGCPGYGDEGLPGRSTRLCGPTAIRFGPDGSLYVSEVGDFTLASPGGSLTSRVRRIDLSTPLAISRIVAGTGAAGYSGDGGQARAAQLAYPRGLAVDAAGALYVADVGNSRIRRVAPDGVITTVAGVGQFAGGPASDHASLGGCAPLGDGGAATQAGLCAPLGVAVGPGGTLYVADQINNRIRKIG